MSTAIIYDTETTGVDPAKDKVIQHSFMYVGFSGGRLSELTEPLLEHFGSPVPISYGAMNVHHIGEERIRGLPEFEQDKVPRSAYLIGQNIDFDWKMIGSPPGYRRIDTLAIARTVYPEAESHQLGSLVLLQHGGSVEAIQMLKDAHNAAADVLMTFGVLQRMIDLFRPDIQDMAKLYEWSEECRIPKKWSFGKFKGLPIGSADNGYMSWYLKQLDTDPYVEVAIRQCLQSRNR